MHIQGILKQVKKMRTRRVRRVRGAIFATAQYPRLSVYRSNRHIAAQIIDDHKRQTLVSLSDAGMKGSKIERAKAVGVALAQSATKKKIHQVVFDRGWYRYHGRVKALADGAKKGGLQL